MGHLDKEGWQALHVAVQHEGDFRLTPIFDKHLDAL